MSVIGKPVIIGEAEKVDTENLWTNSSPTAEFTAKTVTMNESYENSDFLLVKYGYTNSTAPQMSTTPSFPKLFGDGRTIAMHMHNSNGNSNTYRTSSTSSATTFAFSNGGQNETASGTRCLPRTILGVSFGEPIALLTLSVPSSWSGGTVTAPELKKYPLLCAEYVVNSSTSRHYYTWILPDMNIFQMFIYSNASVRGGSRAGTIDRENNQITFGGGYYNGGANDAYIFPTAIIGFKSREVDMT